MPEIDETKEEEVSLEEAEEGKRWFDKLPPGMRKATPDENIEELNKRIEDNKEWLEEIEKKGAEFKS